MKMANWIVAVLVASMLAVVGCSRAPKPPKTQKVYDVDVAMPELQQSLSTNATPEIQASVGKMAFGLRYRNLPAVLTELEKLANDPSLNDAQKKLVAEVTEQVKQAQSKAATAPNP